MAITRWRKSTRSGTHQCVEVGRAPDGAAVRDTKDPSGEHLTTTTSQWSAFVSAIKNGRFDR